MSPLLSHARPSCDRSKSLKIIAKTLFSEMRQSGYGNGEILSLSTELIDLVTADIQKGSDCNDLETVAPNLEVLAAC